MGEEAEYALEQAMMYELEMELAAPSILEQRFMSNIWTTQDGRTIALRKMTEKHIINSIRFIKRGGRVFGYASLWLPILEAEIKRRN